MISSQTFRAKQLPSATREMPSALLIRLALVWPFWNVSFVRSVIVPLVNLSTRNSRIRNIRRTRRSLPMLFVVSQGNASTVRLISLFRSVVKFILNEPPLLRSLTNNLLLSVHINISDLPGRFCERCRGRGWTRNSHPSRTMSSSLLSDAPKPRRLPVRTASRWCI